MINSVISITQDSLVTVAKDQQGFRGGIALTDRGGKNHRLDTVGDRVGYGLRRERRPSARTARKPQGSTRGPANPPALRGKHTSLNLEGTKAAAGLDSANPLVSSRRSTSKDRG